MVPHGSARDSAIASARNWRSMSRERAPSALRMPISFVRSVTDTSMMFMMPIPATISATAPIRKAPIFTPRVVWLKLSIWLRLVNQ